LLLPPLLLESWQVALPLFDCDLFSAGGKACHARGRGGGGGGCCCCWYRPPTISCHPFPSATYSAIDPAAKQSRHDGDLTRNTPDVTGPPRRHMT